MSQNIPIKVPVELKKKIKFYNGVVSSPPYGKVKTPPPRKTIDMQLGIIYS